MGTATSPGRSGEQRKRSVETKIYISSVFSSLTIGELEPLVAGIACRTRMSEGFMAQVGFAPGPS